MSPLASHSFNELVTHFLGRALPEHMASAVSFPELPVDVKRFIIRMLALMRQAAFPVTDVTPVLVWQLSNIIPGFLPCAWGGRVPPLTLPGRNAKMDDYVLSHTWLAPLKNPVLVDMGCGFPPITTLDTATALSGWRVYGVDRSFCEYALYDRAGNYACFDDGGTIEYFQPTMDPVGIRMYQDPVQARRRFEEIFRDLRPSLSATTALCAETVEKDGHTLIRHPIRSYESAGLTFVRSEMEHAAVPQARVVRCMNTLIYFDSDARLRMLSGVGSLLTDSGILIAGANLMNGSNCRYTIYRRNGRSLEPEEFALSVDNLRSVNVMPWYTIHEDDPDAMQLAAVIRTIREAEPFWRVFSGRLDELMADYRLFQRESDGFLYVPAGETHTADFASRAAGMWRQVEDEGFADGAVSVLKDAGFAAWKNQVGDIAIRPGFPPVTLAEPVE